MHQSTVEMAQDGGRRFSPALKATGIALLALPLLQTLNLLLVSDVGWRKALSDFFQATGAVVALIACIRATKKLRREADPAARGWVAITTAAGLWAAGMISFMIVEVGLQKAPLPSYSDFFFVSFYPAMFLGLWRLPSEPTDRREFWNCALDVGALGVIAALAIWHFNLRLVISSLATAPQLGTWLSLTYSLLDFALLLLFFSGVVRKLGHGRNFVPTLLLAIGFFCLVPTDLLQSYITTYTSFTSGSPIDIGWVLFSAFLGFAALWLLQAEDKRDEGRADAKRFERLGNVWTIILTYCWIGLVLAMLIWALGHRDQMQPGVLLTGVAAATVLAITRQIRAHTENTQLYRRLAQLNSNLEQKVLKRTAQLQEQRARLEVSEAFRRRVFDSSPIAIVVMDAETHQFLDCNPAAVDIYRLGSRALTIGKIPNDVSAPVQYDGRSSVELARTHINNAITSGSDRFEWRHRRPDGEEWDGDVILQRFDLGDRSLLQYTVQNITDRKRAEAERVTLQAQLIQAQKMEAVGQLAGGVAHDFNNILTVFLMHLCMLKDEQALSNDVKSTLVELEESANRAVGLTRQLLLFSRRQVVQKQLFDLDSMLGNLLKMLRRLIGEHISIEFKGAQETPWVFADSGMLEQVVMNLVVNARDAMTDGGRISLETTTVEIDTRKAKTHPDARSGRYVLLRVSDTGCGMDAATLRRIFEPFFTTKSPGKGTGLGLATVFGIVKQHDGWVEVESTVGAGTAFNVYVPESTPADSRTAEGAQHLPVTGGSETILLVEDSNEVRLLTATNLQRLGYRVLVAENGQQALERWASHSGRIDLLVTDMVMPEGLTGLELSRRLRKESPALRIIIMSGYSLELSLHGGLAKDRVLYLQKPFEPGALASMVRQSLDTGDIAA